MEPPPSLKVECVTWNAHGFPAATIDSTGNVGKLFDKSAETDVYVVSLQEIVPLYVNHILFGNTNVHKLLRISTLKAAQS